MKALILLEEKILAELHEVQEIQNKLANTRMVKNLEYSDPQTIFFKEQGSIDSSILKSSSTVSSKGLQKTKFMKRVSTLNTDCSHITESQTSILSREKSSFKPSLHLLSGTESTTNQTEDTQAEYLEPHPPKKGKAIATLEKNADNRKKSKEKRRWSLLENEDEGHLPISREKNLPKTPTYYQFKPLIIETSASKDKKVKKSRDIPINILVADYNKENQGSINQSTPTKPRRPLGEILANTPGKRSLMNSKKKENIVPEFSFRPQLSAKSMRMAEAMVDNFHPEPIGLRKTYNCTRQK